MWSAKEFLFPNAAEAEALGLSPDKPWGLLCVLDENGERWTLLDEADYVRLFVQAHNLRDKPLQTPPGKFVTQRKGWPADWVEEQKRREA